MIKKLLISFLSLGLLLLPVTAFGAYNDVSVGTSAIISINDSAGNPATLSVSGSADTVESITVGASSFSVSLQPNSTLTVSDAGRHLIDTGLFPSANVSVSCTSSASSVTISSVDTSNLGGTISLSANACGAAAAASSGSSSGSNGPIVQSGGGGGGSYIAPTINTIIPTQSQTSLQAQIAALSGQITAMGGASGSVTFTKNLTVGSTNGDVKNLQKILNSNADTKVAATGVGSPGKETTYFGPATKKAIQKFQVKYRIAQPGQTGYGVFGPKTKAKVIEIAQSLGM